MRAAVTAVGPVLAYALYRILDWSSYGKMSKVESACHAVALSMMIVGAVGALYNRRQADLIRRELKRREGACKGTGARVTDLTPLRPARPEGRCSGSPHAAAPE
jgi:hypothetical protein